MTQADFIATQRTDHGVPHAVSCRALGVAESTFYEQRSRQPTPTQQRRADLDAKVKTCFAVSGGTYGSPRVYAQPGPRRRDGLEKDCRSLHGVSGPARPRPETPAGSDPRGHASGGSTRLAQTGFHRATGQPEMGRGLPNRSTLTRDPCSSRPSRTCSPGVCSDSRSPTTILQSNSQRRLSTWPPPFAAVMSPV